MSNIYCQNPAESFNNRKTLLYKYTSESDETFFDKQIVQAVKKRLRNRIDSNFEYMTESLPENK